MHVWHIKWKVFKSRILLWSNDLDLFNFYPCFGQWRLLKSLEIFKIRGRSNKKFFCKNLYVIQIHVWYIKRCIRMSTLFRFLNFENTCFLAWVIGICVRQNTTTRKSVNARKTSMIQLWLHIMQPNVVYTMFFLMWEAHFHHLLY